MSTTTEIAYATTNPFTGEEVRRFDFLPSEEVAGVVRRAHEAFLGWRATGVEERAAVVGRAADLMLERIDDLAGLITLEMGKRISESQGEVQLAASILRYYADRGPGFLEPQPLDVAKGEAEVVHEPVGVVLGIEPWNFPLYQVVRVAGPNLVLGNTVLLKHSEVCPQSALALEQLFADAGAPAGVYTNVFLHRDDVEAVIADPAVQGVTLTGSEGAGSAIAALAGKHLKKCVLELGGSDPFIVLDGENLATTAKMAAVGRLGNTGQSCIAAKRIMVVDDVYDDFVTAFVDNFQGLEPGDPADPATALGPLSSERAASALAEQLQDAVDHGATVLAGGGRPEHPGAFVSATVLAGVTPEMRAYTEELFGPVAVVYRVKDEDEAVELANSSAYGLGGAVFGADPERARAVADRLESGMVWINSPTGSAAELPFGGVKRSGFGRELSEAGISEFANRKLVRTMPARKPRA
jgi:succinate-semialdehyde dehydrogenase/glutarate-semialdehyde dehydrogenase